MTDITIYHNPRCSKSRQTLQILQEHDIDPEVVLYLETPPSADQLKQLLKQLGKSPRELLRKSEQAYKDQGLNDLSLSDDELIQAMLREPRLIERPIVVKGQQAVLGRPPENVLGLIQ